eukprot:613383-Rhodomonas_salina.5
MPSIAKQAQSKQHREEKRKEDEVSDLLHDLDLDDLLDLDHLLDLHDPLDLRAHADMESARDDDRAAIFAV